MDKSIANKRVSLLLARPIVVLTSTLRSRFEICRRKPNNDSTLTLSMWLLEIKRTTILEFDKIVSDGSTGSECHEHRRTDWTNPCLTVQISEWFDSNLYDLACSWDRRERQMTTEQSTIGQWLGSVLCLDTLWRIGSLLNIQDLLENPLFNMWHMLIQNNTPSHNKSLLSTKPFCLGTLVLPFCSFWCKATLAVHRILFQMSWCKGIWCVPLRLTLSASRSMIISPSLIFMSILMAIQHWQQYWGGYRIVKEIFPVHIIMPIVSMTHAVMTAFWQMVQFNGKLQMILQRICIPNLKKMAHKSRFFTRSKNIKQMHLLFPHCRRIHCNTIRRQFRKWLLWAGNNFVCWKDGNSTWMQSNELLELIPWSLQKMLNDEPASKRLRLQSHVIGKVRSQSWS